MHILIYMYINKQFSLLKTRETCGGRFLGLLEAILVDQKMNLSVPSVTCDRCDLSSNPVGLRHMTDKLI